MILRENLKGRMCLIMNRTAKRLYSYHLVNCVRDNIILRNAVFRGPECCLRVSFHARAGTNLLITSRDGKTKSKECICNRYDF